jgi:hypothetical protein
MTDRWPEDSHEGEAGAMLPAWPSALVVIAHPDDESFGRTLFRAAGVQAGGGSGNQRSSSNPGGSPVGPAPSCAGRAARTVRACRR